MGTWSSPNTSEKAERLVQFLSAPLAATDASSRLYDIVGDDELFDMIAAATDIDAKTDVRGLVALKLDEWLNWMEISSWTAPWSEEAVSLVNEAFEEAGGSIADGNVLYELMKHRGAEAARDAVAMVLDLDDEAKSRLEVIEGFCPGTYAVQDGNGTLYRFECVYGVVQEAPASLKEGIEAKLRQGAASFRV